jgi:hypothetical protein
MLAFILAASLAVQAASPAGSPWDNVLSALTDAQMAVDRIGHCTTALPARRDLEEEYQALLHRTVSASHAAQDLNPDIDPAMEVAVREVAAGAPSCTAGALRSYSAAARGALAIVEAGLRANLVQQGNGLWIGNLHLCAGRVVAVEIGEPRFHGGQPGVILRFSPEFATQVRALTAQRVGRSLAVVLDGRVIMSPRVNEPISDAVSIVGPEVVPVDRIRAAVAEPC